MSDEAIWSLISELLRGYLLYFPCNKKAPGTRINLAPGTKILPKHFELNLFIMVRQINQLVSHY